MSSSMNLHDVSKVTVARDSEDRWTTLIIDYGPSGNYGPDDEYGPVKTKFEIILHHREIARLKIRMGQRS